MKFNKWLDTFVEEKELDLEHVFEVDGPSGTNYIPLGCVVDEIKATIKEEQDQIKHTLVRIDFVNGDTMDFFGHLAQALAR